MMGAGIFSAARHRCRLFAVRLEGADHQWRKVPHRELSIAPVADERFGRVTGRVEPRDEGRLGRLSDPTGRNASEA